MGKIIKNGIAYSAGGNITEVVHTELRGTLASVTTVLGLVNALLEEYRAERKNVRFENGSLNNTILTDLPQAYGYLTIKVGGTNIIEITFAYSNLGFKKMYYGYLSRTSSETLYSSLNWEEVTTKKVADVARTALTFNESAKATTNNELSQANSYIVRNGICYVSIDITTNSVATDVNTTVNIADGLPTPAQHMSATATPFGKTSTTGVIYISTTGNLCGRSLISNSRYVLSFSYPIAD